MHVRFIVIHFANSSEFETVVEVRHHRLNLCPKKRKRPRPSQSGPGSGGLSAGQALSGTQDQEKVGAESGGGPRGSNDLPQWSALLQMASELDDDDGAVANKLDEGRPDAVPPSSKPSKPAIDNEGRGTVACFICKKAYFIKSKLKQVNFLQGLPSHREEYICLYDIHSTTWPPMNTIQPRSMTSLSSLSKEARMKTSLAAVTRSLQIFTPG